MALILGGLQQSWRCMVKTLGGGQRSGFWAYGKTGASNNGNTRRANRVGGPKN